MSTYTVNVKTAVKRVAAAGTLRTTITTKVEPAANNGPVLQRMLQLGNPKLIRDLLQQAAVETLIKEMKRRFAGAEQDMLDLQLDPGNSGAGRGKLQSSPKFKDQMQETYRKIFDTPPKPFGTVGIGWAPVNVVEQVKTPTHKGKTTRSKYTTMWKQLEFGTGKLAVLVGGPYARTSGKYKFSDGSWVYGRISSNKKSYRGLHLLGTRPGNFLWNQDGEHYTTDIQELQAAFYRRLTQAITGQAK